MALTFLEKKIDDVEPQVDRRRQRNIAEPGTGRRSSDAQAVEVALVGNQPRHGFVAVENGDGLPPPNLSQILTQPGLEMRDLNSRHD